MNEVSPSTQHGGVGSGRDGGAGDQGLYWRNHFTALVSLIVTREFCLFVFFPKPAVEVRNSITAFPPLGLDAASFLPLTPGSHPFSDGVYVCDETNL